MRLELRKTYENTDVCDLIEKMLRFERARDNNGTRISVYDALDHPVWKGLDEVDDDIRPLKVARR
jgi:hypothetical protein